MLAAPRPRRPRTLAIVLPALAALALAPAAQGRAALATARVSVGPGGVEGDGVSGNPHLSARGRFVVFYSAATNLVPGDTNAVDDIFVRDRRRNRTRRVTVSSQRVQANDRSSSAVMTPDARFVAYGSFASNLVPGDTNGVADVFVRDRARGTTRRVSVGAGGVQGNGISYYPAISADGRIVAFWSQASNLVPGDTNGVGDIFVRNRARHTTRRISVSSSGAQGNGESIYPVISADGRFVAFESTASNLVPGDTNGASDVFVYDRRTRRIRRVSVSSSGVQGDGPSNDAAISADGHVVAFDSLATNLVAGDANGASDVFVRNRATRRTRVVSVATGGGPGNGESLQPSLSADGRVVAFWSSASDLVAGDANGVADAFRRDLRSGVTRLASQSSAHVQGDGRSVLAALSGDGRVVTFESEATNLVASDGNGAADVFVRGRYR